MSTRPLFRALVLSLLAVSASAHEASSHQGGIQAAPASGHAAAFDLLHAKITTEGNVATFHMAVAGEAGSRKPAAHGQLAGSTVYSYVWPTTLDPASVGFAAGSGILALAVTSHPDFDDTPLFPAPLGAWHSHWVVLQGDEQCGKGALKVVDIPAGSKPRLPKTWPGLPLLIDSPGWVPRFKGQTVEVKVAFDDIGALTVARFDGVAAALRVNASLHDPLLCVTDVFKIASGDLSLPGGVNH
ncbi:hypothetical protein ACTSKR_15795 [Chitinibacteraceae bacterium HSL-7]